METKTKQKNIVKLKSYQFAVDIVKLSQYLQNSQKEYVLSRQILKSGTSIGALIREAEYAQSRADFIHKLSISLKEANETMYWLDLLSDCLIISGETFNKLKPKCLELVKLLTAILNTTKSRRN